MLIKRESCGTRIATFVTSMFSVSAMAAQGGQTASQPTASGQVIEEVIVSVQKRDERLIDTPLSVSVLSADVIVKLNATQLRDLANGVPGLTFTTGGAGYSTLTMRGVTSGRDTSPTVGIYLDEVPIGSSTPFVFNGWFAIEAGLSEVERIEVLRGPQGTLYGASTMGGLLKYVTKRPDTGEFAGEVRTGISSTTDGGTGYHVSAAVNLPLANDFAALRLSGYEAHDGGYIDNVLRGESDVNSSDIYGGRADLLLTPTDALSIRLNALAQNIARDGEGTADYAFSPAPGFAGVPVDGKLEQRRGFAEPFDQEFRLVSGTVNYQMDWAAVTWISSYQTISNDWNLDLTTQIAPLLQRFFGLSYGAVADSLHLTTDKFAQEVRLTSSVEGPVEWLVGAFYTDEKSKDKEDNFTLDLAGQPTPNNIFHWLAASRYEELAGFGDLTWHVTDKFDVTGGARFGRSRLDYQQTSTGLFGSPPSPPLDSEQNTSTYLGNARYKLSDHATLYVRVATGFRPGGPAIVTAQDPPGTPNQFEPDRLTSYEAGFKAETEDRHFGIEAATYYIVWKDIQLLTLRGVFSAFTNAAEGATIRGAELALTARPVSELNLTGAFAYQDARVSDEEPLLNASADERLPNVPRFTSTLNADYTFSDVGLQPRFGATVGYISERRSSFDLSTSFPQHVLPAYTTVDLRAGVTFGSVDAQLYIRNALNEDGQFSAFSRNGTARVGVLQPRTIGLSAIVRF